MNGLELKKMIKSLVRECVDEILADKFLRLQIENKQVQPVASNPVSVPVKIQERKETPNPKELLHKLGLDESDPTYDIFVDTAAKSNSSLPSTEKQANEAISERDMQKAGFMDKDWSKYF